MRFTAEHPVGQRDCDPELLRGEGMAAFARAAEAAGFDAVAFTEHPAPSRKWLGNGGHASLDPLAALAFCAAATTRIRLLTYLLVLPYRNPLLMAKAVATVDRLSGGRLTIGAGSGYLRSEFGALGVDFEERGALLDEALDVLRGLWAGEAFELAGRHFTARGQESVPGPVQLPHPPVWLGGNGRNSRRRVARAGQGWAPLLMGEESARTARTTALTTPKELAVAVGELRQMLRDAGRAPDEVDIQVHSPHTDLSVRGEVSADEHRRHLDELTEAGATWFVVRTSGRSVAEACEVLAAYGRDVIARAR
ncbi:LLM class F420-dependent oxidoreductase [Streptomyces cylindrosporus]|uniref:LLM class F420-dependent oxidoreductase n=1 Tax=Streptomyces cylindrosporus TaxID=2927583 RepID=A0ABS9Y5C6_9ACTN|nr:LLM class F420-dependent oxidoreductase [Streptomyces cylindrosporus]MCI3272413.1 LLM class F420-dependent oxidoreductase [Streptomyces cylindrosporus]